MDVSATSANAGMNNPQVLHWLPNEGRWEPISWDAWMSFRELSEFFVPLPGINNGIHYFVVVIHDNGTPLNVIPQKYLIDRDGRIGNDNFAGLTRQEREDYQRLMIATVEGPDDRERLNEIREKMGRVNWSPEESMAALRSALPQEPEPGSLAAQFFDQAASSSSESSSPN